MRRTLRIFLIIFLALYAMPLTLFAVYGFIVVVHWMHPLVAVLYLPIVGYSLWALWRGTLMLPKYNPSLPSVLSPQVATQWLVGGLLLGLILSTFAGIRALSEDGILTIVFGASVPAVVMAVFLLNVYIRGEKQRGQRETTL
jgi:hypothetical protein